MQNDTECWPCSEFLFSRTFLITFAVVNLVIGFTFGTIEFCAWTHEICPRYEEPGPYSEEMCLCMAGVGYFMGSLMGTLYTFYWLATLKPAKKK